MERKKPKNRKGGNDYPRCDLSVRVGLQRTNHAFIYDENNNYYNCQRNLKMLKYYRLYDSKFYVTMYLTC